MRKKVFFLVCAIILTSLNTVGCMGLYGNNSAKDQTSNISTQNKSWGDQPGPSWAMHPPKKEGFYHGVANAEARNLNAALEKANQRATLQIARTIQQRVRSWQEDYQQSMGGGENGKVREAFESLSERMVDENLQGVEEVKRAVQQEYGIYRAWVMVRYTQDKLENQFNEAKKLKTEFSREKAREKLEQRTE